MKIKVSTFSIIVLALIMWSGLTLAQSPGNALDFDGSNDFVTVPDAAALDITDQITIEGWFKPSTASWKYKKLITVDKTKVLATQSNFPVLVSVTDTDLLDSGNGGSIQPDGDDILFRSTDGSKLPHEIEQYDGSTGKLIAWVKVPTLSSVTDTEFYLYYGNSSCSSQQDADNTWDSNFKGVWHLNDSQVGTTIFEDGFESAGASWDDKWDEVETTTWEQSGAIYKEGSYSAWAYNNSEGNFTSNAIDASGATFINIDFWAQKDDIEAGEFTLYFFDGTGYDLIADLDTLGADDKWHHFSMRVTDSQYLISNFRIRFNATISVDGENVYVDGLTVVADGPDFTDSSPAGNDGVKYGSAETTGYISNGQVFDGIDDYVNISTPLSGATTGTISAWIKHDTLTTKRERYISIGNGMFLRHDGASSIYQLDYGVKTNGSYKHLRVNGALSDGIWYHVAGTWDGTTQKVFLNGQEQLSQDPGGTLDASTTSSISQESETMDGLIDEARISNIARDSSWIATEFNNQSSPGTFLSLGSEFLAGISKWGAYALGTDNTNAYASINDQLLSGSINAGEWNHIALTYNKDAGGTDEMKLYINGTETATADYSTVITSNSSDLILGDMSGFIGMMDEVRLWNDVRTEQELRENMHRVVTPGSEANLVGYWQHNESSGTSSSDSKGSNTGTLSNMTDGDWVASSAPFGGGAANSEASFTSGTTNLGNFSMTTTDAFDNAVDLTATEISNAPDELPAAANPLDDRYWVVNEFGTPGTYAGNVTFTLPEGYLDLGDEANLKLYYRDSNSDGAWSLLVDGAALITTTTVTFNGVSSLGQFSLAGSGSFPMPVELIAFTASVRGSNVHLYWATATEVNNYGFEVHRSVSDGVWDVVGFVEGHGNSNSPKEYEFSDDLSTLTFDTHADLVEYRLKQLDLDGQFEYYHLGEEIDVSGITSIEENLIPEKFELSQNYPNPFNPSTRIKFALPVSGYALLEIYNSVGQRVAKLVDGKISAGHHEIVWDAGNISSGLYIYKITTESFADVKKMVLLK